MKYNKSGKAIRFFVVIAFVWGIPLTVHPFWCIHDRLKIDVEGRIIERQVNYGSNSPWWAVTYKILQKDGTTLEYCTRYGFDVVSLSREIPVGAYLINTKTSFTLWMEINMMISLLFIM